MIYKSPEYTVTKDKQKYFQLITNHGLRRQLLNLGIWMYKSFERFLSYVYKKMWLFKLLEDGVPMKIKMLYVKTNWTKYVNRVFQCMHMQWLTTFSQMKTASITKTSPRVDLLVICDTNDVFISEFLKYRVLQPLSNKKTFSRVPLTLSPIPPPFPQWATTACLNRQ